jgi:hypothetical protein
MRIELIPVIEIGYINHEVLIPKSISSADDPNLWNAYYTTHLAGMGFSESMSPYFLGTSFFRLKEISDDNLKTLVANHIRQVETEEYLREIDLSLSGGYVLKIDGKDQFYPQCCGELSDIHYWDKLVNGMNSYCEGHPAPFTKFTENSIEFDFSVDEFDEPFQPTPPDVTLIIEKILLKEAVEKAKSELRLFAQRLKNININENLAISNIDEMLIWNNSNHGYSK